MSNYRYLLGFLRRKISFSGQKLCFISDSWEKSSALAFCYLITNNSFKQNFVESFLVFMTGGLIHLLRTGKSSCVCNNQLFIHYLFHNYSCIFAPLHTKILAWIFKFVIFCIVCTALEPDSLYTYTYLAKKLILIITLLLLLWKTYEKLKKESLKSKKLLFSLCVSPCAELH